MGKHNYRLQLCKTAKIADYMDPSGKTLTTIVTERGQYLQANGEDVWFAGYVTALNRAAELNKDLSDIRWVPVERGYEKQVPIV